MLCNFCRTSMKKNGSRTYNCDRGLLGRNTVEFGSYQHVYKLLGK